VILGVQVSQIISATAVDLVPMRIEFAFGFVKVGNGFAFPRVGERHWFGGEANQK
jgi:hypothetical protein